MILVLWLCQGNSSALPRSWHMYETDRLKMQIVLQLKLLFLDQTILDILSIYCVSQVPQPTCFFKSDGDPVYYCVNCYWVEKQDGLCHIHVLI